MNFQDVLNADLAVWTLPHVSWLDRHVNLHRNPIQLISSCAVLVSCALLAIKARKIYSQLATVTELAKHKPDQLILQWPPLSCSSEH
jgi:hypothetical protein